MSYPYQEILRLRVENEQLKAVNEILRKQIEDDKKYQEKLESGCKELEKLFTNLVSEIAIAGSLK